MNGQVLFRNPKDNWASLLIDWVNKEIGEYEGEAIAYIDKHYDNAWSKTIDRFDYALSNTDRSALARIEAEIYKASLLILITAYRRDKEQQKFESARNKFFERTGR